MKVCDQTGAQARMFLLVDLQDFFGSKVHQQFVLNL